ncbi:RuBisCO-associated protein [Glycine soja]
MRVRSSTSMLSRCDIFTDVTEYQLCLAYAGESGKGKFEPKWDTDNVTPQLIEQFKLNCDASGLPVKVFVSIGGDDPFKVAAGGSHKGPKEALCTTGFVASLAPDATTNETFYLPLYRSIDNSWIGTVVFQCFVDFEPLDPNRPVESLVRQVEKIVGEYDYYDSKILLGYSAIKEDWNKVSPPLFFLALNRLVHSWPRVKGASVKVISDTYAFIPPTWIPKLLSLAVSDAGKYP